MDGNVWGGEVLVCDYQALSALPTWNTFPCREDPLPSWSLDAWRSATCFTISAGSLWDLDIPFVRGLDRPRTENLLRVIERGINSPLTSSTGRLFDAVAALAGIRDTINYEAQAAIELEAAIEDDLDACAYPLTISKRAADGSSTPGPCS